VEGYQKEQLHQTWSPDYIHIIYYYYHYY